MQQLTGQNLIPFVPERETAAMLAFYAAFRVAKTTVRTVNVTSTTAKPSLGGRK